MNLFVITILGAIAMAAAAPAEDTKVAEPTAEEILLAGNNQFTARMFTEVAKINAGKSSVLSAFSVLIPLAQLGLASVGESHDELLRTIGMPNDNVTKEVFSLVNKKVRSVKGVELKMASRIYIPEGLELNDNFKSVSRDVFDSDVKNVNFAKNTETAAAINSWVEDNTNHRIKDLVDPGSLTPTTRAVLVNAIYFKGKWQDPFPKANTIPRDFHVTKDNTIQVPTMYRKGDYLYTESKELDAKLLRLPYEGGEASMLIILPNKVDGIVELEEKLKNPTLLTNAVDQMYTYEVDVYLPLFKIETTTNLQDVLKKMGVSKLFSPGEAKLNNLLKGESDLYVSDAVQKAFIEVNEEGAEAAAANEFVVMPGAAMPHFFIVDRPFFFTLKIGKYEIVSGRFRL